MKKPRSILQMTLGLAITVVLAAAGSFLALVLLFRPPLDEPISAYEVARLLDGRPVAMLHTPLQIRTVDQPPTPSQHNTPDEELVREAIASYLRDPKSVVFFHNAGPGRGGIGRDVLDGREFQGTSERIELQHALYSRDKHFDPYIFNSFSAGVQRPDGRWRVVSRTSSDPFASWQWDMISWIAMAILLILPFAWLFSQRIAAPIRAFSAASEQLGKGQRAAFVKIEGPAEIQSAAVALNDMQARLERFVAERTSMVAAIAHDLRTPLARLAFHMAHAPDDVRSRAEKEVGEMEQMVTTVLDFVHSESHRQEGQRLDLGALVESVVDDLADTGHDARVSVTVAVTVTGDPFLLRRLFSNLVTNAVAYGEHADVAVSIAGSSAVVEVLDRGPGLSAEDQARVFEPFFRGESSRNRTTGGIGLGLAIVQTAVRHHGGTIQLHNRPEGGLCVRVTLPMTN